MANAPSTQKHADPAASITARAEAYAPLIAILTLITVVAALVLLPFD